MRKGKLTVGALCALTLGTAGTFAACKKNPIDAGIELALDNSFAGFYEASDGTQVEITFGGDGFRAEVRKVGSTVFPVPVKVGDSYMIGMGPTGKPGEYRGYVTTKSGFLDWGTVTLSAGHATVAWDKPTDVIPTQASFNKIATPSTPTTPTTPSNPGTPSTDDIELLYKKNLEGNEKSETVYTVTVPSGAKKLVVKTFEEDIYGHNLGDLYVKFGSRPTIVTAPKLTSTECNSVNSNREDEVCTFTNPAAGTWYITLYGYHAYYGTSLRVTYSK